MKKYIILLIISLMFISPVFAQKVNTDDLDFSKMKFSKTENPVAYKYFNDYANMLYKKMKFKKLKSFDGIHYRYKICSDGTITDLNPLPQNYIYTGTRVDKYFQDFLKNNPPPPYPENMEIGDVYINFSATLGDKKSIEFEPYRASIDREVYSGNHIRIEMYNKSIKSILWRDFWVFLLL